jgi:protein-arginine kinase activator protein McsA
MLHEISKYGTPEERQETRVNIFGAEGEPEKNETQSESSVLSQIKELERLEKEAVEKEDYEKSAMYRDRIFELKEKLKRQEND